MMIYRRDRYLRGGDHIPFLERGFTAVRFTEANEDYDAPTSKRPHRKRHDFTATRPNLSISNTWQTSRASMPPLWPALRLRSGASEKCRHRHGASRKRHGIKMGRRQRSGFRGLRNRLARYRLARLDKFARCRKRYELRDEGNVER